VQTGVVLVAVAGALVVVAVPVFNGQFAQTRIASVSADLDYRRAHWDDALAMRDPGWVTMLLGMGLGRFPETEYWRSNLNPKVGTYQLQSSAGNAFLRLDAGDPISLDQFVAVEPGQDYLLKLDVRPSRPGASITVPVCEKSLLTSATCVAPIIHLGNDFGVWRSIEARFNTSGFVARPWYGQRPIKISLTYAIAQSTIDIDNIRLETVGGTNLLRNGDFSQGLDHWLLATAGALHAQWRVHSLYYAVLFDQGWLGVLALAGLIVLALSRGVKNAWQGHAFSTASLASFSGFLAGGLFDTQIDAPRFLLLLLLLAWSCL
jgi:hypothetical protein